jgi:hypothetical protein
MHWYYVEPTSDAKWQVVAEGQAEPRVFEDREAAVTTAERDARGHFTAKGQPSGVRVRHGGHWRDDEVFAEGRGRRRS